MSRRAEAPALPQPANEKPDVVHEWRVSQLVRLGLAWPTAEVVADKVDWHEVARLVRRGCPASLAVCIVE